MSTKKTLNIIVIIFSSLLTYYIMKEYKNIWYSLLSLILLSCSIMTFYRLQKNNK